MKKKKNIIIIIILIVLISLGIIYQNNKEYKYICLNINLAEGDIVSEVYLEECTTNKRLKKGVITKKEELIPEDFYTSYKTLKKYNKGEILYKSDFEIYIYPKSQEVDVELLKEIEVMNHGNSSEEFTKYKAYIKDNKLYAKNLKTNEEKIIFSKEKVASIAIRPFCCAGNAKLLILTTTGNVYISKKDCHYSFNFDFPFEKINISNIKGFKLIPKDDYDPVKELYGITSNEEIKHIETNWD